MLGQNLEDAVIVERFFRGGPLAHLSRGIEPGGYFLEMGALDGITFSNTRLFEHCLGWDGLLIEAQPTNAERCKRNRPCAEVWGFGICDKDTKFLRMAGANGVAFDTGIHPDSKEVASVRVPCVPLSELLRRNNVRRINFLSLDVEGAELKVLQTVDWSALQVDVLMVEAELSQNSQFALAPSELRGKIDAVRAYLTSVGFTQVPSRVQCNSTSTRTPCHRNGQKLDPMYLGIAGSDLFVGNLALLEYDREPWRRGAR
jgi:FkbM family methyltransferase